MIILNRNERLLQKNPYKLGVKKACSQINKGVAGAGALEAAEEGVTEGEGGVGVAAPPLEGAAAAGALQGAHPLIGPTRTLSHPQAGGGVIEPRPAPTLGMVPHQALLPPGVTIYQPLKQRTEAVVMQVQSFTSLVTSFANCARCTITGIRTCHQNTSL